MSIRTRKKRCGGIGVYISLVISSAAQPRLEEAGETIRCAYPIALTERLKYLPIEVFGRKDPVLPGILINKTGEVFESESRIQIIFDNQLRQRCMFVSESLRVLRGKLHLCLSTILLQVRCVIERPPIF